MVKAGVLVHMYHLESPGWESQVWGDLKTGRLGVLPKLVQLLLLQSPDEPIDTILMYKGPSRKDRLGENEYTKKYLLDHIEQLRDFPQLSPLIESLSSEGWHALRAQLQAITTILEPQLKNTADEITHAAEDFRKLGVTKIYDLAVSSHAPRCLQLQSIMVYEHKMPEDQFWYTVPSDTTFEGTTPNDVVIAEPATRADDPAYGIHPSITELMNQYYELPYEKRIPFLKGIKNVFDALPSKDN